MQILRPNHDEQSPFDDLPVKSIEDIDLDALDPDTSEDDEIISQLAAKIASAGEEDISATEENFSEEVEDDDLCEGEDDPEDGSGSEDDGPELPDPLDELTGKRGEVPGPRLVFLNRSSRTLVFTSTVDFIRTARELASQGVELYE